jgi:hypothetical protein
MLAPVLNLTLRQAEFKGKEVGVREKKLGVRSEEFYYDA